MERTKRNSAGKKNGGVSTKIESTIVKTVRKGDVVTKWDENKYVIVAIDNGHEKSTITKRLMKILKVK